MRFKREDAAYAGATAVAAAVIVYLTIGNFGLVPSPFAAGFEGPRPIDVPALQAVAAPGEGVGGAGGGGTVQSPGVPSFPGTGEPGGNPPPPVAADVVPPAVSIGSPNGAILISLSGESVGGTASDDSSGVGRVAVTFTPLLGQPSVITADLACTAGLNCSWTAAPPSLVGNYTVEAEAFDQAGNSAKAGPISITIVEAQPSSQSEGVGGAVDAVVGTVGTVVETAGELLSGLL